MTSYQKRKKELQDAKDRADTFEMIAKELAESILTDNRQHQIQSLYLLQNACKGWAGYEKKIADFEKRAD